MDLKLTGIKGAAGLTDAEILEMGRLLLKAGYAVRVSKKRPNGKTTGAFDKYLVLSGGDSPDGGE